MTPSYLSPASVGVPPGMLRSKTAVRSNRPAPSPIESIGLLLLCTFLFLMFGRPADFLFPSLHLPLIVSVAALLTAILGGGAIYVVRTTSGLLMTALTAWFLLAVVFSTHRGGSLEVISGHWMRSYLCFVLILAICRRTIYIRRVIQTLAWSVLVASLLAFIYGVSPHGRIQLPVGFLSGPNELASVLVIGMLYWMFILFDPAAAKLHRLMSIVAMIPIMLVLIKTGSRGGILTLAITFSIMFLRFSLKRKIIVLFGGMIMLLLALLVLPDDLRRRYTTYFDSDLQSPEAIGLDDPTGSTTSRLYLLERSLEFTVSHPVFGVGPAQYPPQEDAAARREGKLKGSWLGTHNTYTQISSETGIPGLLLFLTILIVALRNTIWIHRRASRISATDGATLANASLALQTVLIAYFILFLFEHTAYLPLWPTLVGMIAALRNSMELEIPHLEKLSPATPSKLPAGRSLPGRRPVYQPAN